ncbi:MAG: CPBP family intramembrane metalloprotease [Patescibacteria group bacterium]|nr:CPBP family intramembrane metalloprotease [Patescibacteria group bacterium]MDD5715603.1 CPBP family intramembrane metalloprotease [Patescibacteria group bacterium]
MHRIRIILEIILVFVVPILWFVLGLGEHEHRLIVFELLVGLTVALALMHRMGFRALGFRTDNFLAAAKLLLPGSVLALAALFILFKLHIGVHYFFSDWYANVYFFYYLSLGVISQEFAYRGFLLLRLKQVTANPFILIATNAVLFAFLHVLHESWQVAIETGVLSAYLTWIYLKQPNIYATCLAHSIVGGAAIILGFV